MFVSIIAWITATLQHASKNVRWHELSVATLHQKSIELMVRVG